MWMLGWVSILTLLPPFIVQQAVHQRGVILGCLPVPQLPYARGPLRGSVVGCVSSTVSDRLICCD